MRALQLLAIAAVCPLAVAAAGCEHYTQTVGTYESSRPMPPTREVDQAPASSADAAIPDVIPTSNEPPVTQDADSVRVEPPAPRTLPVDASEPPPADPEPPSTMPPDASATAAPDAGSNDASAAPAVSGACVPTDSMPAQLQRVDMYIVMDANFTLPIAAGLWEFATTGLRDFWRDPHAQHLGLGLRFYGTECDPAAYDDRPTVEIGLAADTYADMYKATSMTLNLNASAMGPALEGGIRHQRKRAAKRNANKQIVVLLTDGFVLNDGFTQACTYTQGDVEDIAYAGFINSVETYVIGFGVPETGIQVADDIIARFIPLDSIAKSGGSEAQKIEFTNDSSKMTDALNQVRRQAQPCEFVLPTNVDLTKLSLVLNGKGKGELPRVDNEMICGQGQGWYFDTPLAASAGSSGPTLAKLCRNSCDHTQDYSATFFVGCPPKLRID